VNEPEAVRENGAFESLTNSTSSGTPIPLHYGMPRVSGQFLSGYVDSTQHGKNDLIKVRDKF
jgi:predicted phage tail protein